MAAMNLVLWALLLSQASPESPPVSPTFTPEGWPMQFDLDHCFDCAAFTMLGREFESHWDPLPVHILIAVNLPSIRAALGARNTRGAWELRPIPLVVASTLQWLFLSVVWLKLVRWKRKRNAALARTA
mgnify:CR=1 FL=1